MRHVALLLALLFAFATEASAGIGPPDTIVVVVRHAEKGTAGTARRGSRRH
jgi:hypothetical protein